MYIIQLVLCFCNKNLFQYHKSKPNRIGDLDFSVGTKLGLEIISSPLISIKILSPFRYRSYRGRFRELT